MSYQEHPSGVLPTKCDYDTTRRRRTTKQEHMDFVYGKIFICIIECMFDWFLMYYASRYDPQTNVYTNTATWLINCTWCSLILYAFKIVMSCCEACGNDDDGTRCWSDASLLLSLWIDVPKSFLHMLFIVQHKNWANMLKAIFVIVFKLFKRMVSLEHHFNGCSKCVTGIYLIGIFAEACFAVLTIGIYIWSKL